MRYIAHRKNTLAELEATPTTYGIEVDIRSFGRELVVHHDPMIDALEFKVWIKAFNHKTLILNVKEEGLEEHLIELMQFYDIEDYFFLDQSFPFLLKYSDSCARRSAIRVSEYESIETALLNRDRASWIWLDCFKNFPISYDEAILLKKFNYKLCAVSPELQGREQKIEIIDFIQSINKKQIPLDAVCTKLPSLWEEHFIEN